MDKLRGKRVENLRDNLTVSQWLRPLTLESWELREYELRFGVWYRVAVILLSFLALWITGDSPAFPPDPAVAAGLVLVVQPLYIWLLHRGPERWFAAARTVLGILQMGYASYVSASAGLTGSHLEAVFPAVLLEVAACSPGWQQFLAMGLAGFLMYTGGLAYTLYPIPFYRHPWFWTTAGTAGLVLLGYLYLVVQVRRLSMDAETDGLTRLYNRRYLLSRLQNEIAIAGRKGQSVGVAVLDLDGFKEVNDRYGHLMGDRVLKAVAGVLTRSVRVGDCVCRYGGDEFVILYPGTSIEEGLVATWRALQSLEHLDIQRVLPPVSASAGLAAFPHHALTALDLLAKADLALVQQAKKKGRGTVAVYRSFL